MNKVEKGVVPELRFPEFTNDGTWKQYVLSDEAIFLKGKGISKKDLNSDGKLPCIRYGELYTEYGEVIENIVSSTNLPKENLILSKKNDVIIPSSGETQEDIATASCVLVDNVALGGDLNIIRSDINGVFFSYYLNSAKKRAIVQMAQGIAVVHLYNSQLQKLEIEVPNPKEQQKIANCLSSLDTLLTAETEKIDYLKDHKKGLLQQLFPANGETKPQYRFPEFENEGDWEETTLGEISKIATGSSNREDSTKEKGEYTFFDRSQDIRTSNRFLFDGEAIIVAGEGQEFKPKYFIGKFDLHQRAYAILDFEDNAFGKFLYYSMYKNRSYFLRYAVGSTVKSLRLPIFENMPTLIPSNPKEQQKIANCLSSADDLIAAKTTKIEALKDHKKGLMQQLFPTVNELAV